MNQEVENYKYLWTSDIDYYCLIGDYNIKIDNHVYLEIVNIFDRLGVSFSDKLVQEQAINLMIQNGALVLYHCLPAARSLTVYKFSYMLKEIEDEVFYETPPYNYFIKIHPRVEISREVYDQYSVESKLKYLVQLISGYSKWLLECIDPNILSINGLTIQILENYINCKTKCKTVDDAIALGSDFMSLLRTLIPKSESEYIWFYEDIWTTLIDRYIIVNHFQRGRMIYDTLEEGIVIIEREISDKVIEKAMEAGVKLLENKNA
jgi:hypothetical protein